jgi:hypothetical protein
LLIEGGHFDLRVAEQGCECLHGIFLPVGEERARRTRVPVPFEQPGLIGVDRKPIQRVDAGSDRIIVAKYPNRILR